MDNENRTQTGGLAHLITEQDVHAYVDGELTRERRAAVEAFLKRRDMTARQAAAYLRSTFDLRAVKDVLYEDTSLRNEVEALLARRSRARSADDAAACSAAG